MENDKQREKEKLIELLKCENGNLDTILSSYQNRRKQEKLKLVRKIGNEMNADEDAEHIDDQDKAPLDENPAKIIEKERKIKSDLENPENNRTREPPRIVHTEILKCLELISKQQLGLPLYASHQRPGVHPRPVVQQTGGDQFGGRGQLVGGGGIERE